MDGEACDLPRHLLMKFGALALDYDGTIAVNDKLHPEVRKAIAHVRQRASRWCWSPAAAWAISAAWRAT